MSDSADLHDSTDLRQVLASPERLAALRRVGLLDTPPEEAFDRWARLAAQVLHAPVALVSLVDRDRQFFKSCLGLPEPWASWRQTPLSHAFCQYLLTGQSLRIDDARDHPLVRHSPAIHDLGIVAYLGVPLLTADGQALGAFCVIDHVPRRWTDAEAAMLCHLAAAVMTEIELRVVAREAEHQSIETAALLDATMEGIYGLDRAGRCTLINRAAAGLLGYLPEEVVGKKMHELIHHTQADGSPYPVAACPIARVLRTGDAIHVDNEIQWRRDGTSFLAECSSAPVREGGRIAGAVVTVNDVTERRRAEAERAKLHEALAEREWQLRDLVGRLILAQEEERRRIAYDIHDGVAQVAAGTHMHLRGFARRFRSDLPDARADLERAVELAQRTVREARTVVAELRPTVLDDLGLEAAVRAELDELRKAGWRVELETDLGPDRLPPAVETTLFRVAQEALRNARKHAQTTGARVLLRRTRRGVRLEVRDWGRGFRPAAAVAGTGPGERVGLSGMRERVALLGGRCEVRSRPGAGTRIVAAVPLRPPTEPRDAARAGSQ